MRNAADSANGQRRLAIDGELSIYTASEWRKRLFDLIAQGGEIELDLCAVEEVDTAGLQLLIMAKKEATARGQRLQLCNHSQAVLEVFELCGVAAFFGDPILLQPNNP